MSEVALYEAIAQAFVAEGVDTIFVLTGDGNMHWEAAFSATPGTRSFHVRHEHCACAMATAYASMTGRVGVASVTCGPGLTQIMTALATATAARVPLVVFAGESPMHATFYNQAIDQAPLVKGTGSEYVAIHSVPRALSIVAEAFHLAKMERRPVVIAMPLDLQRTKISQAAPYQPSALLMPDVGPVMPHPAYVKAAAERIARARNVVVMAGRGAKAAGAGKDCEALAEWCGGLLATTLPVRGLFDHNPRAIGVAGGFSHQATRAAFATCDLVVAVGASLTNFTTDGGALFPNADVIQIDVDPRGLKHGRRPAGLFVRADCRTGVATILDQLERDGANALAPEWNATALAQATRDEPADRAEFAMEPGLLDPRAVIASIDRHAPKDWVYVNSSGHCSWFAAHIRDVMAENFLTIREFGAIGNGLSYAIGAAAANPGKPVLLIDGDGGFMMHAQELDTVRRYNLPILFCILNDGAYGSEIHKLRADGLDDHGAIFGRGNLARMAEGFGLRGAVLSNLTELPSLLRQFQAGEGAMVLDIHISDQVTSPVMRRATAK